MRHNSNNIKEHDETEKHNETQQQQHHMKNHDETTKQNGT